MTNQKIYNSKELNEILGYIDVSGRNNAKEQIIPRCCNAGLIIQALDTPRGMPNQYIILEDNFHLEGEEWITCFYNDAWEVSNLGRIRRKNTKKLMGSRDKTSGYMRVSMLDTQTNKQTNQMVHRLIYFSFHPELIQDKDKLQIDHINGIRTDNRLDNLQALTCMANIQNRENNQEKIKLITTELIIKYGYEKVEEKLKYLLTNGI